LTIGISWVAVRGALQSAERHGSHKEVPILSELVAIGILSGPREGVDGNHCTVAAMSWVHAHWTTLIIRVDCSSSGRDHDCQRCESKKDGESRESH